MARRNLIWAGVHLGNTFGGAGVIAGRIRVFSWQLLRWLKIGCGDSLDLSWDVLEVPVSRRPFWNVINSIKYFYLVFTVAINITLFGGGGAKNNFSILSSSTGGGGGGFGKFGFGRDESPRTILTKQYSINAINTNTVHTDINASTAFK